MTKTYIEKLKDPRWQRVRLKAMESSDWSCECCGAGDKTLHVHHKQYLKGRDPWEYEPNQLSVLCEACHQDVHSSEDLLLDVISRLPVRDPSHDWIDRRRAAFLIAGVAGLDWLEFSSPDDRAWFFAGLGMQGLISAGHSAEV